MRMKQEYVVLVIVIAALSVYIALKKTGRTHYEIPTLPAFEKEEISRLTIRKGGEETTLIQAGDGWVVRPGDYPADRAQVDGMLDAVKGLTLTSVASEAGNDGLYELDEAERIEVEAGNGDEVLRSVYVGKAAPTNRHTFVKLSSEGPIYHAGGTLRNRFEKNADQLRDMQVMKIDDDVTEITLTEGDRSIHLLKSRTPQESDSGASSDRQAGQEAVAGDTEWLTGDGKPVKSVEVDGLIQTLSNLKCDAYVKDEKREDKKNPTFTVSLKGTREYVFSVYGEDNKKFVCTSSENDYVFLIPEWRMKKMRAELDQWIETNGRGEDKHGKDNH